MCYCGIYWNKIAQTWNENPVIFKRINFSFHVLSIYTKSIDKRNFAVI